MYYKATKFLEKRTELANSRIRLISKANRNGGASARSTNILVSTHGKTGWYIEQIRAQIAHLYHERSLSFHGFDPMIAFSQNRCLLRAWFNRNRRESSSPRVSFRLPRDGHGISPSVEESVELAWDSSYNSPASCAYISQAGKTRLKRSFPCLYNAPSTKMQHKLGPTLFLMHASGVLPHGSGEVHNTCLGQETIKLTRIAGGRLGVGPVFPEFVLRGIGHMIINSSPICSWTVRSYYARKTGKKTLC